MAVVQYKTPGVYVEELDAFPPSIVGVETAVPVFIGYTAKAEKNGRSLALQPIRIGSMVEYTAVFGGAHKYAFKFTPMAITAADVKDAEEKAKAAEAAQTAAAQKVTDAGTDETKKASAQKEKDAADAEVAKLRPAADKLKANFEKTPAGAAEKAAAAAEKELDDAKKKTPAATQAELDALKDKAAPLRKKANEAAAAAAVPRDVRIGDQDYGLVLGKNFYLYNCLRLFYANGGGNCYIVSVGTYDAAPSDADLTKGLDAVHDLVGPTMLVIPEAAALADTAYDKLVQAMLKQCLDTQDRVAILDVYGTAHPQDAQDFTDKIARFREKTIGGTNSQFLRYGMAYTPFLRTSIVDPAEVSFMNFDAESQTQLQAVIEKEVDRLYPEEVKPADGAAPGAAGTTTTTKAAKLKAAFTDQLTKIGQLADGEEKDRKFKQLNQNLSTQVPVFKDIYASMARQLGTLPPSAAMAGVYTQNDALRGVWNAPANVGLVAVTGPTYSINTKMQDDLNMPIGGLAVNAIRDFVGRGTLVWGARTLDGNSNDWRYIQVRRALIYIEQSVELALNKFVFEPNIAQTWVTVASMIGSFLRGVWQAGGLMGASPNEAFSVQCGLGSTMTAQDVLEGRMIVQIKLQMVRPAEFIVLTFQQQMQGGAA